MPASQWTFYNSARKHMMDGTIDLDSANFAMALYTSGSNAATVTLSTKGSVTSEVLEANGYSSSGKPLTAVTWAAGASAREMRWNAAAIQWLASNGDIADVKYAVIWMLGATAGDRKLVCYTQLSTSQFTVTSGNSLTVTPSANGIFELNG
ncbi:MAG TPA: hypothetical protein VFK30_11830 [Anaerolineae bacterium]|nr:hypothetical protein [Anaerolineae bacterium]